MPLFESVRQSKATTEFLKFDVNMSCHVLICHKTAKPCKNFTWTSFFFYKKILSAGYFKAFKKYNKIKVQWVPTVDILT